MINQLKLCNFAKNTIMTKFECSILRGLAILCIILHNYSHSLPGIAKENEFAFSASHNEYFCQTIIGKDFILNLFSYWGYLGVPIFVFLSGYGLTQKYDKCKKIYASNFLRSHYLKLFVPLLLGTLVYMVISFYVGSLEYSIPRIILQCTMLLNIVYPYECYYAPGPYWYFGLTMQFYIIYYLFVYKKTLNYLIVLTILSHIILALLQNYTKVLIFTKYNFIGWMLPFCMGVIFSRKLNDKIIPKKLLIIFISSSFLLLIIFGYSYQLWLMIPIIVVIIALCLIKLLPSRLLPIFNYIGKVSLLIFVIHPIVRNLTLSLALNNNYYWGISAYVSITICVAFLVSQVLRFISVFCKHSMNYR